ncbi:MAG: hypothetical protein OXT64_12740 [Gammaproteobacteria bacterium]|nr:hypothetical protein [Gammaproteobacteria bacterium]MDE0453161.1 hypothetical protein [Gammaproteobacteria bacterium]
MNRGAAGRKLVASTDSLSQATADCVRRAAVRYAASLLFLGSGSIALAAGSDNLYQAHTNEELSELAADWESLTTEERRDYFIEVRRRMAEAVKNRAEPPPIVGERRFGRIIRQPDGSVLHIEGVVRYRDRDAAGAEEPSDYGTGFEQRAEQTAERGSSAPVPPVMTVGVVGETEVVAEKAEKAQEAQEAEEEEIPETTARERAQGADGRE